jgi:hypothetical protein
VELEGANALLQAEFDTAHTNLVEVEHHERTLTFKNEGLKRDLESARTAHDAAIKDKAVVQQTERTKLQWFQDSVHEKLAELQYNMEASIATLGERSAKFPADASLSDFFKWF